MKSVNVWSEFQPLKRVILGAPFPPETFQWHKDEETKTVMEQIFRETAEDLSVLETILKDKGVEDVRSQLCMMKTNNPIKYLKNYYQ